VVRQEPQTRRTQYTVAARSTNGRWNGLDILWIMGRDRPVGPNALSFPETTSRFFLDRAKPRLQPHPDMADEAIGYMKGLMPRRPRPDKPSSSITCPAGSHSPHRDAEWSKSSRAIRYGLERPARGFLQPEASRRFPTMQAHRLAAASLRSGRRCQPIRRRSCSPGRRSVRGLHGLHPITKSLV